MQEWWKVPKNMKKLYTTKEESKLREAKVLLSIIKGCKSPKFVLKAVIWNTRRKLKKLDETFFKPRVDQFMFMHGIKKMEHAGWYFQTFEVLTINEKIITDEIPPEVLAILR